MGGPQTKLRIDGDWITLKPPAYGDCRPYADEDGRQRIRLNPVGSPNSTRAVVLAAAIEARRMSRALGPRWTPELSFDYRGTVFPVARCVQPRREPGFEAHPHELYVVATPANDGRSFTMWTANREGVVNPPKGTSDSDPREAVWTLIANVRKRAHFILREAADLEEAMAPQHALPKPDDP